MHRFTLPGLGCVLGVAWSADGAVAPALAVALGLLAAAWLLAGLAARPGELALGLSLGLLAVGSLPEGPVLRGPARLRGTVVSAATGRTADVAVAAIDDGGWVASAGRVRVRFPDAAPTPGTAVVVSGVGQPVALGGPPGAPDMVRAARLSRIRTELRATEARSLGGDPAPPSREVPGLLRAIALGDRSDVDAEMLDLMRRTGTAHLLAVSGSNVALAAGAGVLLARLLLGVGALRRPGGGPAWLVPATASWAALAFTVLVGLPTSAQRALVGVLLIALARAWGRWLEPMSLLGLCALLVIAADPSAVASASFHLSFGAVLGLVTWGRTLDGAIPAKWPSIVTAPLRLLAASGAATIGTLPASAWWFQSLPPLGILANLFAVPWTTFVLTPCAFGALMLPDLLANPATVIGVWATEVQRAVLIPLAVEPWHPAVGPAGAVALCALYVLHERPVTAVLWTLLVVGLPVPPPADLRLTFFDVGQGDATLVQWPDGETWLIDGGWRTSGVNAGLRRMGVRRLDRVIATHGDKDHAGGLTDVLRELDVGALYVAHLDGLDELLQVAADRGVPVVDDPAARLHPPGGPPADERNDAAIVVQVGPPGQEVLLPADISGAVERRLLDALGPVAVLKVPHHGSRFSTTDALLTTTRPALAVVSAGRGNDHGHPHPSVLARLARHDVPLLRTDVHGTVQIELGERPRWRSHRYGVGWSTWAPIGDATPPPPPPPAPPPAPPPGSSTAAPRSRARRRRGTARRRTAARRTRRASPGTGHPAAPGPAPPTARRPAQPAPPPRRAGSGAAARPGVRPPGGHGRSRPTAGRSGAHGSSPPRSSPAATPHAPPARSGPGRRARRPCRARSGG